MIDVDTIAPSNDAPKAWVFQPMKGVGWDGGLRIGVQAGRQQNRRQQEQEAEEGPTRFTVVQETMKRTCSASSPKKLPTRRGRGDDESDRLSLTQPPRHRRRVAFAEREELQEIHHWFAFGPAEVRAGSCRCDRGFLRGRAWHSGPPGSCCAGP